LEGFVVRIYPSRYSPEEAETRNHFETYSRMSPSCEWQLLKNHRKRHLASKCESVNKKLSKIK
jgi:hypothetical protein